MRVVAVINYSTPPVIDSRLSALRSWLSMLFHDQPMTVLPVAGDASFRRYFRAAVGKDTFIVMDAPPEKENCAPFIAIANAFEKSAARFPTILSHDLQQGFLLLPDFGDRQLLPLLDSNSADALYKSAMDVLLQIQQCDTIPNYHLPQFDDAQYWREFEILDTWYIKKNLNKNLSAADENQLKNIYQLLIDSAHAQPQLFVHRDYHSRNIMLCDDGELGILAFQDALLGPITYDLVSLLRDCYIAWPDDQTESRGFYFYQKLNLRVDFKVFMRWFDLMGLQRHLKCLGIFSRLYYRDGKEGYLKEIPRVLNYVMTVCDKYPELQSLTLLLQEA
ncbi:MAG: phosphotransferase [Gammaproteobacteria bacterium]|nr:phosphotransferase [Gammaproteobacteria bacterium]